MSLYNTVNVVFGRDRDDSPFVLDELWGAKKKKVISFKGYLQYSHTVTSGEIKIHQQVYGIVSYFLPPDELVEVVVGGLLLLEGVIGLLLLLETGSRSWFSTGCRNIALD
jgi:hypothetical protein